MYVIYFLNISLGKWKNSKDFVTARGSGSHRTGDKQQFNPHATVT